MFNSSFFGLFSQEPGLSPGKKSSFSKWEEMLSKMSSSIFEDHSSLLPSSGFHLQVHQKMFDWEMHHISQSNSALKQEKKHVILSF